MLESSGRGFLAALADRAEMLRPGHWFLLILVAGLFLRVTFVVVKEPPEPHLLRYEVTSAARTFAATGVLANPYKEPTGPTAHLAPAFPIFAGLVLRITGEPMWGWALKLISCLTNSVCWALLPWLAIQLGLPYFAGVRAGLLGALLPLQLWVETNGGWETVYGLLVLIVLLGVTSRFWRREEANGWRWLVLGAGWGASMLIAAGHLFIFLAVIVLGSLALGRATNRKWIGVQLLCVLGAVAALAPWTFRNEKELGGFAPIRSNAGIEWGLSFRDGAGVMVDFKSERRHPNNSSEEAIQLGQMGELAYNRMRMAEAIDWISRHRAEAVWLTVRRFARYWFLPYNSPFKSMLAWSITILGILGLGMAYRRNRPAALLLIAVLIGYPLPYYFHVLDNRYGYPVYWVMILMASYLKSAVFFRREAK